MIGLDTNVLVRFFIRDDHKQYMGADTVMNSLSSAEPGWVGLAVLMELVWVLTSVYRVNRQAVLQILDQLLSKREIIIERAEVIRHATRIYGDTKVGFSDCLISASAQAAGCTETLTFDKDAAKATGMTLVQ
jgi:predicted nucleic-acid-binding protein